MHNGLVRGFHQVKRGLSLAVAPELYPKILGSTDSELMFKLALSFGLEESPMTALERMAGFVEKTCADQGIDHALQLSVGLSDDERLLAVRYSTEGASRTLFHSTDMKALQEINPDLKRFSSDARAVVSEPLSDLTGEWEEVPESTALVIHRGEIQTHAFQPRLPD